MTFRVPDDEPYLKAVIDEGHDYYVLVEQCPEEDCRLVSEYFNADQNQNKPQDVPHLIRGLVQLFRAEMTSVSAPGSSTVPSNHTVVRLSALTSKMQAQSMVKISPVILGQLGKFVSEMGAGALVDEMLDWLAINVNSGELQVSPNFFHQVSADINRNAKLVKKNIIELAHNEENKQVNCRPLPDFARFISLPTLQSLGKSGKAEILEGILAKNREELKSGFSQLTNENQTLNILRQFEHAATLACLGMQQPSGPEVFQSGVTGMMDAQKLQQMRLSWLSHVKKCEPCLGCMIDKVEGYAAFEEQLSGAFDVDNGEVSNRS